MTGETVRTVKAFAALSADPGTAYAAAQISVRSGPGALHARGAPERLTATLNPGDSITLRWKARKGAGAGSGRSEWRGGLSGPPAPAWSGCR